MCAPWNQCSGLEHRSITKIKRCANHARTDLSAYRAELMCAPGSVLRLERIPRSIASRDASARSRAQHTAQLHCRSSRRSQRRDARLSDDQLCTDDEANGTGWL
jgi:hypothetical protein